jgi:glutamine amidotransferase
MCRLTAWSGPAIALEQLVVLPAHSLLEQSHHAVEAKLSVNGDGFGIAWFGAGDTPGLYRDVLPAWSDGNLPDLCRMIQSHLFLAHVRASTSGETARVNCHPFRYGRWCFMHNGQIGGFERLRRPLEASLPDSLYLARRGTTDSELFFLLLLANGLCDAPNAAVQKALHTVHTAYDSIQTSEPIRITAVFSNGCDIYAFRYASDAKAPTLYTSATLVAGGTVIASEPLDDNRNQWQPVADSTLLRISKTELQHSGLAI